LLYLPVHVVWLELIIHPTALLVFQDLPEDHGLQARRRTKTLRFFSVAEWLVIAVVGIALTLLVTFSYVRSLGAGYDVEHARAMALVVLTLASAGLTVQLSRLRTPAARIMAVATVTLSLLLVQVPVLSAFLHLKPLHLDDWLLAIAGGALTVLLATVLSIRIPRAAN
jgi:Ca2+-transporting ATPase